MYLPDDAALMESNVSQPGCSAVGWCQGVIDYDLLCPFGKVNTTDCNQPRHMFCFQTGNLVQTLCQVVGVTVLLAYTRQQRQQRTKVLLPIYEVYIRMLFVVTMFDSVLGVLDTVGFVARPPYPGDLSTFLVIGVTWGSFHTLFEGIVFLLLSRTLGSKTIRRVQLLSCAWFFVTFGMVGGAAWFGSGNSKPWKNMAGLALFEVWNVSLFVFYCVVGLFPQRMIPCHRRPAARTFGAFFALVRAGNSIADLLTIEFGEAASSASASAASSSSASASASASSSVLFDLGYCLNFAVTGVVFSIMVPFVVYFALLSDSRYWRGEVSSSSCSNSHRSINSTSDIRTPLMGLSYNYDEVHVVQESMEGVPSNLLIDFHELSLNPMKCLGIGGTARVYRGVLQGKPVAIKMLICPEITQELVANFFQEAVTLSVLSRSHPNIVDVRGICVAPPALCIVLELCAGSLFDSWQETNKSRATSLEKMRTQSGRPQRPSTTSTSSLSSFVRTIDTLNSNDGGIKNRRQFSMSFEHTMQSLYYQSTTVQRPRSFSSNNIRPVSILSRLRNENENEMKNKNTNKTHPVSSLSRLRNETENKNENKNQHQSDTDVIDLLNFLDTAIQCVRPVAYLHQLRPPRCHRDIKSLNYLVSIVNIPHRDVVGLGPEIKLADMETVSTVSHITTNDDDVDDDNNDNNNNNNNNNNTEMPPIAYTPQWCAPEVMRPIMERRKQLPFKTPADVFSLTMVLYECLTHQVPFYEFDSFAKIDQLVVVEERRPSLPHWIPPILQHLFNSGWHQDPLQRCTAHNMLERLINMYKLCGVHGEKMFKYQIAVSHAILLGLPQHKLVRNRKWRGINYKSCCVNTELINFVICNSNFFVATSTMTTTTTHKKKNKGKISETIMIGESKGSASAVNQDLEDEKLPMTKIQAIAILQNLVDYRLMQHVTGEHEFISKGPLLFYSLLPSVVLCSRRDTNK